MRTCLVGCFQLGSSRGASIQHTAISLNLSKSQVYSTVQLCIPLKNDILGSQFPLKARGRRSKHLHGNGFIACEATVESDTQKGTVPDNENEVEEEERGVDGSVLTGDGSELRNTLRLVECAMLAATAGLAYFLSNLLRLEVILVFGSPFISFYLFCLLRVSLSLSLSLSGRYRGIRHIHQVL